MVSADFRKEDRVYDLLDRLGIGRSSAGVGRRGRSCSDSKEAETCLAVKSSPNIPVRSAFNMPLPRFCD